MRIGLIARADRTGLGVQTFEFYRHMKPVKTMVIEAAWKDLPADRSLYPDAIFRSFTHYSHLPNPCAVIEGFLDGLDVVFTVETPYNYWLFQRARERGVKTVLQYNFEFLAELSEPDLPRPDLYGAPSLWRFADLPFANKVFLPVPVARDVLPFRERTQLRTLLHVGGFPAIHDRNGTYIAIEAMRLLPSDVDVRLRVRMQSGTRREAPARVEYAGEVERYSDLYGDEDALLLPRKFGGLCLPMNEAASCGMAVLASAVEPQVRFLPTRGLLLAKQGQGFQARSMIDLYDTSPQAIADRITELWRHPEDVAALSRAADRYADSISWERLRPFYVSTFERLCNGQLPAAA